MSENVITGLDIVSRNIKTKRWIGRASDNSDAFSLDWPTTGGKIRLKDETRKGIWKNGNAGAQQRREREESVRRAGEAWNENVLECLREGAGGRALKAPGSYNQGKVVTGVSKAHPLVPRIVPPRERDHVASPRKRNPEWACPFFPGLALGIIFDARRDWLKKEKKKKKRKEKRRRKVKGQKGFARDVLFCLKAPLSSRCVSKRCLTIHEALNVASASAAEETRAWIADATRNIRFLHAKLSTSKCRITRNSLTETCNIQ